MVFGVETAKKFVVKYTKSTVSDFSLPYTYNYTHLQINISGRCDSDSESININMALLDATDISITREGACLTLNGSGTLEMYREILLSAR